MPLINLPLSLSTQGVFVSIFLLVSRPLRKYREVPNTTETEPLINKHLDPAGGATHHHSTFR